MAINFPSSPTLNDIHNEAGKRWKWNGYAWDLTYTPNMVNTVCGSTGDVYPVCSLNGFTGAVSITAGNQITVVNSNNTITISTTNDVSSAVAGTGISVSGATGSVTITNIGVQSFNGLTGAVTGVSAAVANTFTELQTFSAGISASGATLSGTLTVTGNITAPNIVTSVNGSTGAITNVAKTDVANTFTATQVIQNTFAVTSTASFFSDVAIYGNLTLSGSSIILPGGVSIKDNIITLNSDANPGLTGSEDCGMEVLRGNETAVTLRWNETTDEWDFTNDGTTYFPFATTETIQDVASSMITGGSHTALSATYDDGAGTLSLTNTGVTSLNGSTGAITDVAKINEAQTFTALQGFSDGASFSDTEVSRPKLKDYAETVNAIGTITTNTTVNFENGNVQTVTVGGNCQFSFSNPPASAIAGTITLVVTNGGAYTTTWHSSIKWPGNVDPTLTASGIDVVSFLTTDGGTTYCGFIGGINFL